MPKTHSRSGAEAMTFVGTTIAATILATRFCVFAQTHPPHMAKDEAHYPFVYGVASGSPLPDGVMIWTYVESSAPAETLSWEVAEDENFSVVAARGTVVATESTGRTAKADVRGLAPGKRYYYRFEDASGRRSVVGRTQTAPAGAVAALRFGVVSCSSVYSGYFNAYRKLSQRNDLDALIHLGDYIYDFVDEDEKVFVPEPFPQVPQTLSEWRNRHAYYLLDPDLRAARQNLPWIMLWDNHDLNADSPDDGARAFWEWNPVRMPDSSDARRIYRSYAFGDLADVVILDALLHRPAPGDDTLSILGETQFDWFRRTLLASTARWRVIGNQKLVSSLSAPALPGFEGDVSPWGLYPGGRERFGRALRARNNNILVGGDAHIGFANDFADSTYRLDDKTGAYAPEFLPNSVSRGNVDEQVGSLFGSPEQINRLGRDLIYPENPHVRYMDLVSHGYGILDVRRDSAKAEFWHCPILEISEEQNLAATAVVYAGTRHWNATHSPTQRPTLELPPILTVYPNPARDKAFLRTNIGGVKTFRVVCAADGKIVACGAFAGQIAPLNAGALAEGLYFAFVGREGAYATAKFCVLRNR
ncbi:MAG: alkaline phosphatase D family protein [Bacteroidia bacterium]|nr:alkaline phosphatase D family protein [Bacteroidia bacterium]